MELALSLGYEKLHAQEASGGVYYQKNDKIWIHNIKGLCKHLGIAEGDEQTLRGLHYDVDAYWEHNATSEKIKRKAREECQSLYSGIPHEHGEPTYLMDGMYMFPDGSIGEL